MVEGLEPVVLELFRVPPEPSPPSGAEGSLQVFRAAPQYFTYKKIVWALRQGSALLALIAGFVFISVVLPRIDQAAPFERWVRFAEFLAVLVFVIQLPFSYAMLRLDYRMRWYMVTDRSLRVREGIASLREKTMTFANIQQLSVEQGPLQRLLGVADVKVQSAGGGGSSAAHKQGHELREGPHEARFRGVANAAELRDLVRDRVRRFRDAGLGDTDDHAPAEGASAGEAAELSAAKELLAEVKGLRSAWAAHR